MVFGMTPQQVEQLATRHAVFVTTASHMQHPQNHLERWRHDWAQINQLVDRIIRERKRAKEEVPDLLSLLLRERVLRVQMIGIVAALTAIALIAT